MKREFGSGFDIDLFKKGTKLYKKFYEIFGGLFVEKALLHLLFEFYENIHTIYENYYIKIITKDIIPIEEQKKIILPAIINNTNVIVHIGSSPNCFTYYVINFITKKVVFNHTFRKIQNKPDIIFFNKLINKIGFYIKEENYIVVFDISTPQIPLRRTYLLKLLNIITVQDVSIDDDDNHIIVKSNEGTRFLELTF